jgi:hypothetical protein
MSFAWLAFTDPACSHPYFANVEVKSAINASSAALVHIEQLHLLIMKSDNKNVKAFSEKVTKLRDLAISLHDSLNHAI